MYIKYFGYKLVIIGFLTGLSLTSWAACPCKFKEHSELDNCKLLQKFEPDEYVCTGLPENNNELPPVIYYGKTGGNRPDRCTVHISGRGEVSVKTYAIEEPKTISDCFTNLKRSYPEMRKCTKLSKVKKRGPGYFICLGDDAFDDPNPKIASTAVLTWGIEGGGQETDVCSIRINGKQQVAYRNKLTSNYLKDCLEELQDIARKPEENN